MAHGGWQDMRHQAAKPAGARHKRGRRRTRSTSRILGWALVLALAMLAVGSVGVAMAESEPTVTINPPGQIHTPTPSFSGAANGSGEPVVLHIAGSSQNYAVPTNLIEGGGGWEASAPHLSDGTY